MTETQEKITILDKPPLSPPPEPQPLTGRGKALTVIAYISCFSILGMLLSPEKHLTKLRFHVGQGFALFLLKALCRIVLGGLGGLLGMLILKLTGLSFADGFQMGWDSWLFPMIYCTVMGLFIVASEIWLFFITVKGVMNALRGKNQPLKSVKRLVFYK
ncbi:MAG: hypothetical protein FWG82_03330 [Oscillospiraceae bacterium]|nr:hypothetical protein [Oscillospiraceae bacterium]